MVVGGTCGCKFVRWALVLLSLLVGITYIATWGCYDVLSPLLLSLLLLISFVWPVFTFYNYYYFCNDVLYKLRAVYYNVIGGWFSLLFVLPLSFFLQLFYFAQHLLPHDAPFFDKLRCAAAIRSSSAILRRRWLLIAGGRYARLAKDSINAQNPLKFRHHPRSYNEYTVWFSTKQ